MTWPFKASLMALATPSVKSLVLLLTAKHGVHHVDFIDYPVSDDTIFFVAPGQVSRAALSGSSAFFLYAYGVGRRSAGGAGPGIG